MTEQVQRRIPQGTIIAEIPLEAAKAYPTRIFTGTGIYPPKIAYADLNSKGEKNTLIIKLIPDGAVHAPHPQIVLAVKGSYHIEEISYNNANPFTWTTWMEQHVDAIHLQEMIDALYKAKFKLESFEAKQVGKEGRCTGSNSEETGDLLKPASPSPKTELGDKKE